MKKRGLAWSILGSRSPRERLGEEALLRKPPGARSVSRGVAGFSGSKPACLGTIVLLCAATLFSDTIALRDGTILDAKVVGKRVRAEGIAWVIEDEQGVRREILEGEIAWHLATRPPWEARAEAEVWYRWRKIRIEDRWPEHFELAKECRRKRLYEQAYFHFSRAYEGRKAETGPSIEEREALADWLLKECELPEAAAEEHRAVYRARAAKTPSEARAQFDLGKWCEARRLFDEAEAQYKAALQADPAFEPATAALTELQNLRRARFHPLYHRVMLSAAKKAADFLKGKQNPDGSFGRDLVEAGVMAHRAVTALAGLALLNVWSLGSVERTGPPPPEIERALRWVLDFRPRHKLRGPDVWGPIFSLDFLRTCHASRHFATRRAEIREGILRAIEELAKTQGGDGGWMYYDFAKGQSASFVTAAALVNLRAVAREGIPVPDALLTRALGALKRCRLGDANFTYAPGKPLPLEGNAPRSPLCELAMNLAGQSSRSNLRQAVENFFRYRHVIRKIKGKKGTHIGQGLTAPYYYLYDHYWTARAIKLLDRDAERVYLEKMKEAILADQEKDGSFTDWPTYSAHQVAGTSLAILTLYQLASLDRDGAGK